MGASGTTVPRRRILRGHAFGPLGYGRNLRSAEYLHVAMVQLVVALHFRLVQTQKRERKNLATRPKQLGAIVG
jgi:hypothetical protein